MKKLLFTDLDGTLIFSKNSRPSHLDIDHMLKLESYHGGDTRIEIKLVEFLNQWQSENNQIIPMTTRSIEQYKRLNLDSLLNFKYAFSSNGLTLYEDGEIIEDWTFYMRDKIESELKYSSQIKNDIDNILGCLIKKDAYVEESFYVYVLYQPVNDDVLISLLLDICRNFGWKMFIQNKKIYFFPKSFDKGSAMIDFLNKYDMNYMTSIFSMGNSLIDETMCKLSDKYLYFGSNSETSRILINQDYHLDLITDFLN